MKNTRNFSAAITFAVLSLLTSLTIALLPASQAKAEGVFISAPGRSDIAYDDKRGVLYISAGGQLLRYQVATRTFLDPITLGGQLNGMDISPDGQSLVVADKTFSSTECWIFIVSLESLQAEKVTFPITHGEGGTWTAAYGSNGGILISSIYLGSGNPPLRWYDPSTRTTKTVALTWANAMVRANADHSLIGVAEGNISTGDFDRYRVSDGNYLHKTGYTDGTAAFNYEIAVRPDGQQYAIPTGSGTFITDAALVKSSTVVGENSGPRPIGVAYDPVKPRVFFPWSSSSLVYAYDSTSLTAVRAYDFESNFGLGGIFAFVTGRAKTSGDGSLLFVTVDDGVRFVTTNVDAPSGLTAIASDAKVSLSWQGSSNATSYVVYAGTSPRIEASIPVLTGVTGTSAVISGLANNTTYYFSVAAQTPAGLSTPSTEASATPITIPGAVTGFSATTSNGQLNVSWQPVPGASSYVLYQGTAPGAETVLATGLTGSSYSTVLSAYGPLYLQLAAVNATGTGPRTAETVIQPAKPPAPTVNPGTYPGRQIVQLFSPTPNATVFFTTDGSTPNAYSSVYSSPLQIVSTTTIKAYARAPGLSNSPIVSFAYSIGGPATSVDMANNFSVGVIGIPGLPAMNTGNALHGYSYSGALLGQTLAWSGSLFNLGGAGVLNASSGSTIALPPGQYGGIKFLALGVNGVQNNQLFVITYVDGSTQTFVQSLSDWARPSHFPNESIALAMPYRQTPAGTQQSGPFNLYGYAFPLFSTKVVKSVTLPSNRNVLVLSMSLDPAPAATAVPVDLYPAANTDAVSYGSPTLFNGIGGNYAYAGQLYPPYIVWSSVPFVRPAADTLGAIAHATAPLPQGQFSKLYLLGTGFKGAQVNRPVVVTYMDGSSDSFVQSFSDWGSPQHYAGETVVATTGYRVGLYGVQQAGQWNIYGYSFSLNASKVVRSVTLPSGNVLALSITLDP